MLNRQQARRVRPSTKQKIPPYLFKWLFATGSLTQQLTQLAQGQFHVQRQHEGYQRLSLAQATRLNMPHYHLAWVRDVELYGCESCAWVKASSIFPIRSVQGRARQFKALKERPIGALLFYRANPTCQRQVFLSDEGWVRQSVYTWKECSFIVQETFLPAFERFLLCQQ